MRQLVREDKTKREQTAKEDKSNGTILPTSSAPDIGSQKYIDNLDIPNAMDDGVALLFYIMVMLVGIIFNDRWLIWIFATIAYLCHVFRRQIHKAKWEREHKDT